MLVLWMLFVSDQYWHTERYKVCGKLPSATHYPSLRFSCPMFRCYRSAPCGGRYGLLHRTAVELQLAAQHGQSQQEQQQVVWVCSG
jgi:hypothetical protein